MLAYPLFVSPTTLCLLAFVGISNLYEMYLIGAKREEKELSIYPS